MQRRSLPLSGLRVFEAAARLGSFKAAAEELAVTPTAVSHQIRALEAQTGLALFDRHVRRVSLTEAGAQLYPVLRDGFDAFEAALARLTQQRTRMQVTISATNAFTVKWLVPRMADFRSKHPGIDLQLQASDDVVDLRSAAVDIAIRYGRGPYPGLVAQPLFTDRFAPVANPRLGVASPDDLAGVPLIRFNWKWSHPDNPTWERWFAVAQRSLPRQAGQLRFSDEGHAIQAAVAGHGVALVSLALIAEELEAGHLVQPFGPEIAGHTYHLAMPADRPPSAPVQAVAHWLSMQAAAQEPGRKKA
ncbi:MULTISPECIES: LysR substrate-binding domain-containing protein [Achromobacter]|uniref:Gcv operon activator n=1 Tax=Achromobacter aegrifaciens TaxID=1287736 RepID=A0AAD2J2K3_ACHAE|nr:MULTISPECIES: LysR substrate-binding domain-containing protein [Achromobacter]MBD9379606.1 LysR family transcriptional regulator [Achromobacter sp. ACM02]MBD9417976.1 LysR family transcriptional regulator [Achromobacter sp. ACM04]MDR7947408.1 LysR substrate-binding domain-containing protein [Achromobacter aegrifaciens]RIJ06197.1 LysR family transcriptional regulator [Achromobacter sp. K91]CUJ48140.1 Gcv operon activator [Achromobacter aegrifaciens]